MNFLWYALTAFGLVGMLLDEEMWPAIGFGAFVAALVALTHTIWVGP